MATNISIRDNTSPEILNISINEVLFKALDKISGICVKEVLKNYKKIIESHNNNIPTNNLINNINNYKKLVSKYNKYCILNSNKTDNEIENNIKRCTECFKKFILEDLIFISKK